MRLLRLYEYFALSALPQLLGAVKFEYYFAPASRNVKARGWRRRSFRTTAAATFSGPHSLVTFDFERNVAGKIQFTVGNVSDTEQIVGLTYSESSLYISSALSDGTGDVVDDLPFNFTITEPGNYTVPDEFLRGAFKDLTVTLQSSGTVEITNLQLNYTAMPHFEDLRAYTGYFHSKDELLNRIWYAGAYMNQICTITPSAGNALTWGGEKWSRSK